MGKGVDLGFKFLTKVSCIILKGCPDHQGYSKDTPRLLSGTSWVQYPEMKDRVHLDGEMIRFWLQVLNKT